MKFQYRYILYAFIIALPTALFLAGNFLYYPINIISTYIIFVLISVDLWQLKLKLEKGLDNK